MVRKILFLMSLSLAVASIAAEAQTKITVGVTPAATWSTAIIAADQGYFAKHNLAVTITTLALNPAILSAIQAGSLEIGGVTPAGFLQAIDGDLDLVLVAGGTVSANVATRTATGTGVMVRPGVEIKSPQDFVGKKIGVPGLGSGLDIAFRLWLKDKGVDYHKVNFVELAFPQQSDALKSGIVDGVISLDPFLTRILDAKTGYLAVDYQLSTQEGTLAGLYTAARPWAEAHPQAARDFRLALAEAYDYQLANPDGSRTIIGKFMKLPPDAVAHITLYAMEGNVRPAQLQYWADAMKEQGWIQKAPDTSKLIFR